MTQSQSSSERSQVGPVSPATPALLQSTCTAPCVSRAARASASTESGSVTSQRTPVTSWPPAFISLVACSSADASTSAITIFMPSAAKASLMPRPMPLAPPVTTATRPSNRSMVCSRGLESRPALLRMGAARASRASLTRRGAGSGANLPCRSMRRRRWLGSAVSCLRGGLRTRAPLESGGVHVGQEPSRWGVTMAAKKSAAKKKAAKKAAKKSAAKKKAAAKKSAAKKGGAKKAAAKKAAPKKAAAKKPASKKAAAKKARSEGADREARTRPPKSLRRRRAP